MSRSSSSSKELTEITNIDRRLAATDQGRIFASEGGDITVTDVSDQVVGRALDSVNFAVDRSVDTVRETTNRAAQTVRDLANPGADNSRIALLAVGGSVVIVGVLIFTLNRRR